MFPCSARKKLSLPFAWVFELTAVTLAMRLKILPLEKAGG